jgi:hypothetical protein
VGFSLPTSNHHHTHPPKLANTSREGVSLPTSNHHPPSHPGSSHTETRVRSVRVFHCFFFVFFHPRNTRTSHRTRVCFLFLFVCTTKTCVRAIVRMFCLFILAMRHACEQSHACSIFFFFIAPPGHVYACFGGFFCLIFILFELRRQTPLYRGFF